MKDGEMFLENKRFWYIGTPTKSPQRAANEHLRGTVGTNAFAVTAVLVFLGIVSGVVAGETGSLLPEVWTPLGAISSITLIKISRSRKRQWELLVKQGKIIDAYRHDSLGKLLIEDRENRFTSPWSLLQWALSERLGVSISCEDKKNPNPVICDFLVRYKPIVDVFLRNPDVREGTRLLTHESLSDSRRAQLGDRLDAMAQLIVDEIINREKPRKEELQKAAEAQAGTVINGLDMELDIREIE